MYNESVLSDGTAVKLPHKGLNKTLQSRDKPNRDDQEKKKERKREREIDRRDNRSPRFASRRSRGDPARCVTRGGKYAKDEDDDLDLRQERRVDVEAIENKSIRSFSRSG